MQIEDGAACSDLNMMGCSLACEFNVPATCCPGTCAKCKKEAFKETLKKARAFRENLE